MKKETIKYAAPMVTISLDEYEELIMIKEAYDNLYSDSCVPIEYRKKLLIANYIDEMKKKTKKKWVAI